MGDDSDVPQIRYGIFFIHDSSNLLAVGKFAIIGMQGDGFPAIPLNADDSE
jgi:hypothetical protein